jgi:hypothetical protein
MSDFPVIDAPRLYANNQLGRVTFDSFGDVEPYLEETDLWVAMPVRLVYDQGAGWHLELGPYSHNGADIERLREAIAAYDQATGGTAP